MKGGKYRPMQALEPNSSLVWDVHACLPLDVNTPFSLLDVHREGGTNVLSINVGMDMNPVDQILRVIAAFRAKIRAEPSKFLQVESFADIGRARAQGRLAIYFDLEGSVMLQDMPEMIDVYHRLGVRQIHFAYNRNNSVAGGCHDDDSGLTDLGREMVAEVNRLGLLMDCSHMGTTSCYDVLACSTKPVIFSHTNPLSISGHARCIDDALIKACAAQGGVIGLSGYHRFLGVSGEPQVEDMLAQIEYVVNLVGTAHIAIGLDYMHNAAGLSDFSTDIDQDYWWPPKYQYPASLDEHQHVFSPMLLRPLATAMIRTGYDPTDVDAILGGNMLRIAEQTWQP